MVSVLCAKLERPSAIPGHLLMGCQTRCTRVSNSAVQSLLLGASCQAAGGWLASSTCGPMGMALCKPLQTGLPSFKGSNQRFAFPPADVSVGFGQALQDMPQPNISWCLSCLQQLSSAAVVEDAFSSCCGSCHQQLSRRLPSRAAATVVRCRVPMGASL